MLLHGTSVLGDRFSLVATGFTLSGTSALCEAQDGRVVVINLD
jgi:hypothetical protein